MADLEMLLVKLDINSFRPALHRGTPNHSTKRTRLQLSATSFFVIRKEQEREGTYATEVYPESGLESRFPPWEVLPSLERLG